MNPTVAAASASSSSINTKISEITGKSACVAWCPITSAPEIIALGAKVGSVASATHPLDYFVPRAGLVGDYY